MGGEEQKAESEPKEVIILSVDLHCIGCAKKIEKSLLRIKGVAGVKVDMVKNQVIIEGVVEPQAVCNKITEKTKTSAKILFPLPVPVPVPVVVSSSCNSISHDVELNVNMHCEACAQQLRHKILKMKGVSKVETEVGCGKVRVMGTMDGEKLVEYVYRRTKKQAKIVPQPQPQAKQQVKKEDEIGKEDAKLDNKEEGGDDDDEKGRMMYDYQPALYLMPPPQLFSDDNPNACSIS